MEVINSIILPRAILVFIMRLLVNQFMIEFFQGKMVNPALFGLDYFFINLYTVRFMLFPVFEGNFDFTGVQMFPAMGSLCYVQWLLITAT